MASFPRALKSDMHLEHDIMTSLEGIKSSQEETIQYKKRLAKSMQKLFLKVVEMGFNIPPDNVDDSHQYMNDLAIDILHSANNGNRQNENK